MFQLPRGTRDFTPEETEKRRYVEENMLSTFKSFGYKEIQTPTFETLELFTAKSGDLIIDEIYAFPDKGGRELALRPELTAPVIRFYVEKMQMEPKPLKLFYFGNCFRYDRPQKGRYREFWQAGCEIVGTNTPEAYAELVTMAYTILKNVGLKNIKLNIGNLNIINSTFNQLGLSKDDQKKLLPLIDKSQFDDAFSLLPDLGITSDSAKKFIDMLQTSDINKIKEFFKEDTSAIDELSDMEKILDLLKGSFNVKDFQIKMSIVRGLDYYKGLVFEIDAPVLGAEKQLCGGGAYDLVTLFGGRETPTAGFAVGFDRTILALETEQFAFPSLKTDVYIIPVSKEMIGKSIEIAQNLRKEGILTDLDLLRRGIGKSLKYANSKNVEKVIIIGPKELENDSVTLRDMKAGDQEVVKIADIVSKLKNN
ncbi:histidyl-tRNA synthetase [Thermoplasmatales archaeon SCGC AB-540-F20]|nr:histidyl-tRNA synthetase [Thermoplasmatales archaeon SCGC AB-540-F20]